MGHSALSMIPEKSLLISPLFLDNTGAQCAGNTNVEALCRQLQMDCRLNAMGGGFRGSRDLRFWQEMPGNR